LTLPRERRRRRKRSPGNPRRGGRSQRRAGTMKNMGAAVPDQGQAPAPAPAQDPVQAAVAAAAARLIPGATRRGRSIFRLRPDRSQTS